jgi:hypothetical protein
VTDSFLVHPSRFFFVVSSALPRATSAVHMASIAVPRTTEQASEEFLESVEVAGVQSDVSYMRFRRVARHVQIGDESIVRTRLMRVYTC